MKINTLDQTGIDRILKVFNESFKNYFVPFNLTEDQLRSKINFDNIKLDLSVGIFDQDELVGFILHGIDKTKTYIYNGGTGVLENYRGKKIAKQLYDYMMPILREKGIQYAQLEVITENTLAKKAYEGIGYKVTRTLDCIRIEENPSSSFSDHVEEVTGDEIAIKYMENEMIPTWQNTMESLEKQKENLIQFLFRENGEIIGNLIANKNSGRISRINIRKTKRRQGVGSTLINHAFQKIKKLSVLNLDTSHAGLVHFFEHHGFKSYLQQYEMLKKI